MTPEEPDAELGTDQNTGLSHFSSVLEPTRYTLPHTLTHTIDVFHKFKPNSSNVYSEKNVEGLHDQKS